ncbi:ankyrin repeat protein [Penicillium malachiteum]|nr:ankyrin repeat protein [Penicillium malachiteum]
MDPLSVFASTIAIIQAISGTYEKIREIKSLSHEFEAVYNSLPIAQLNIECAEEAFDDPDVDVSSKEVIDKILWECNEKADSVERNLREGASESMVDKMSKAHRVETLMKEILEKLHSIGLNKLLRAATQEDVEKLETAIKQLAEVKSSVPDFAFETGSSNTQNIAAGGTGYQNNGGSNVFSPVNKGLLSNSHISGGVFNLQGYRDDNGTE